ncbi:MAG: hypothetical protein GXO47_05195 [Chlorobi bacterium]|nr:hypothetical protein [Chlorobiota bacterium]
MAKEQQLTDDELHFLGIKVVYKAMIDEGYEVLQVRKEYDINPQILAKKDGIRYFIVVRTARYPDMGVLKPEVAARVLKHAKKNKATCLFAPVGIANANGENDEEMKYPIRNGEYYINFKGFLPFPK